MKGRDSGTPKEGEELSEKSQLGIRNVEEKEGREEVERSKGSRTKQDRRRRGRQARGTARGWASMLAVPDVPFQCRLVDPSFAVRSEFSKGRFQTSSHITWGFVRTAHPLASPQASRI